MDHRPIRLADLQTCHVTYTSALRLANERAAFTVKPVQMDTGAQWYTVQIDGRIKPCPFYIQTEDEIDRMQNLIIDRNSIAFSLRIDKNPLENSSAFPLKT